FKLTHGSLRAVVRDVFNNSESRTTISAVGKGVTEAAVNRGENLPLAILTGSDIW
ncbi:unnamed protein product, partial [marine sediment metagenome]